MRAPRYQCFSFSPKNPEKFSIECADYLVDPKRPPRFENNVIGTIFHHHFYVKTIDSWVPTFFIHNILYTILVEVLRIDSAIPLNLNTLSQTRNRMIEIVFENHFSRSIIACIQLSVWPASDEFFNAITIEIITENASGIILWFDSPPPANVKGTKINQKMSFIV